MKFLNRDRNWSFKLLSLFLELFSPFVFDLRFELLVSSNMQIHYDLTFETQVYCCWLFSQVQVWVCSILLIHYQWLSYQFYVTQFSLECWLFIVSVFLCFSSLFQAQFWFCFEEYYCVLPHRCLHEFSWSFHLIFLVFSQGFHTLLTFDQSHLQVLSFDLSKVWAFP